MDNKTFHRLLMYRIALTIKTLGNKSPEYASDTDKLHNFKRAGKMLNCSPAKALMGMKAKHDVSILDIVDKIDRSYTDKKYYPKNVPTVELIEEKIGDSINYLILLEAIIKEELGYD